MEGNRQSVLKTTKVRTALKGDNSWIQRRQQDNLEQEEDEKPWIAEVRGNRSDGVLEETSPVSTATTKDPLPTVNTEKEKASSGYLIRGVFTKTDAKPTSTSSANGYAGVNSFTKKSSNSYKKIAPHTIRVNNETPVQSAPALNEEEMEKRTAAASSVLKGSAASQRSYVMSAAKKYDSSEQPNSSTQTSTSFVAKRVVISDDEDLPTTEPAPSASQHSVKTPPKEPPAPLVKDVKPVPAIKPVPKPTSLATETKPVVETKTAVTATKPLAELKSLSETKPTTQITTVTESKPTSETKQVLESKSTKSTDEPKTKSTTQTTVTTTVIESKSTAEPKPASETKVTIQTKTETQPKSTAEIKQVAESKSITQTTISTEYRSTAKAENIPTSQKKVASEPTPDQSVESLTALSDTLISFNTEPARTDPKLIVEKRNGLKNDDLLDLSESKPSLDLLSQDLLTGGSSLPYTKQTQKSLDLLTDDVLPSNTSATRISTDYTYSRTTVKESSHFESCDDPFDPIPVRSHRTKSHEWYSDPISDSTSSSTDTIKHYESPMNVDPNMSEDALVSLAEDVIPFNTKRRNWTVNMESSTSTKIVDTADEEKLPESESKKGFVYVKEYVNNSHLDDSSDYVTSSTSGYNYSSPSNYSSNKEKSCTFCGELVGNDTITIEHLNISCHPSCFKCGICSKPMGDLLYNMFLHRGTVHCESCYSNVL
ncbi:zinc finger protein 185 isoform X2 [Triplophysa dalaica]|uniref:zinc finger protein 185 isoform X2 n=1 Tax=Triplophysa dalaica TaxID=1582913 RepID=UPI0024DF6F4D|nr:zinc finger protein 185 isoform X2 [Triplophysa dalaica]